MSTTHDITILVYITDVCNMKCSYCYNIFPRNSREIDSEILLEYLDDMFLKTNRCQNILLIGGEPTLYSKLFQLIQDLRNRHFIKSIEIFTNFSRNLEFYEQLIDFDVKLVCSWHNETDDKDFLYKLNFSSEKMKSNVVEISMMFEHQNVQRWKNVIKNIDKFYYDVLRLWILYSKSNVLNYDDEMKKVFSQTALELNKVKISDFLRTKNIYNTIFEYFSKPYQEEFLGRMCSAGFDTYYIHNNGNVYKCQNDFFYEKNHLYNIFENNSTFEIEHYSNHICTCNFCRHGNFNVEIFQ